MKSLLTITPDEFEKHVWKLSNKVIKGLLVGIREVKSNKLSIDQILDIERKETKAMKVLQARGYLTLKNDAEYHAWLNSIRKKELY